MGIEEEFSGDGEWVVEGIEEVFADGWEGWWGGLRRGLLNCNLTLNIIFYKLTILLAPPCNYGCQATPFVLVKHAALC